MAGKSGGTDPMVVSTADLRDALLDWASGRSFSQRTLGASEGMASYLESESGLAKRRIWSIMNIEYKVTTLDVADRLLMAIERPDALHTTVKPMQNPKWSRKRWIKHMARVGECKGCGCDRENRTKGCHTCVARHSKWKKRRAGDFKSGRSTTCTGCGHHHDQRTRGCRQCTQRHCERNRRARLAAVQGRRRPRPAGRTE